MEDIAKRRLKISRLDDLNDPFELLSVALSDPYLRQALQRTKAEISATKGLLCFSDAWSNPVQWGHYAEKHRGVCLGFEASDAHVMSVSYTARRLSRLAKEMMTSQDASEDMVRTLLCTKYAHWRYEREKRIFVGLEKPEPGTGHYFAPFSDELRLVQVIVGAQSDITRKEVADALRSSSGSVEAFKARLAFQSFRVVRNRQESLWA